MELVDAQSNMLMYILSISDFAHPRKTPKQPEQKKKKAKTKAP
jgi:hypothetical protein